MSAAAPQAPGLCIVDLAAQVTEHARQDRARIGQFALAVHGLRAAMSQALAHLDGAEGEAAESARVALARGLQVGP